jgi:hypothetical protein
LPKLISKCVRIVKNKTIEIRIATIPVEFLMSKIVSYLKMKQSYQKKLEMNLKKSSKG